jgi:hypothetical protein
MIAVMPRIVPLLLACLALAGCGSLVPDVRGAEAPRAPSRAAVLTPSPQAQQCLADLGAAGARFSSLPDRYVGEGCALLGTVSLSAVRGDFDSLGVSNLGPVACSTASAFSEWARFGVDRAARQLLGSPIARIETMGSYACRNVAGSGRRSAHATADAIDIAAFVLEDGRRVSVLDHWQTGTAAEREFLRVVQRSACKRFRTVLGPEYNAAHRDHFHLERGGDGGFCR